MTYVYVVYLSNAVWVGMVVKQECGDVRVFVVSSDMQRRQVMLAERVDVHTPLQQQPHHLSIAVLRCDVKCTETFL